MNDGFTGIITGKTIELDVDPGLAAGSPVKVFVQTHLSRESVEEKIRRLAGSEGDDPDDDRILEEIYHARHSSRPREVDK